MLPEEDRQALKKNGYISTNKGIKRIDSPLQTHNRKSFSTEAQHHRHRERDQIENFRATQPKATPIASNTRRYGSADAEERWRAGSSLKPKPKPTSTPIASNTRRYGSADAEERWRAGSSLKPKHTPLSNPIASNTRRYGSADAEERWHTGSSPKPKPIPGSAADLPEARKAFQQTNNAYQHLKSHGGRPMAAEVRDLQRETSVAKARVDASEADKKRQDFPTQVRGLKSQNRGITEEIRSDLAQRAYSAKEKYMGTQGLDSSGQPIKLTPRPPAPQQSKPEQKKHWWDKAGDFVKEKTSNAWDKTKSVGNYVKDHAEGIGHTALDVGGMIPVAGAAFDGAHAAWYLAKGDKVNAALSAASAIPFAGDALAAGKLAFKAGKGAEKLVEAGTTVSRATNVAGVAENGITKAKDVSKLAQVVKDTRVPKTHITYTLRNSDGVVRYTGLASGKGTPQEVLEKRLALDKRSKKHHIIKEHGEELKGGEARLEGVHGSRAAAEGGEDVLYSRYQIRGKDVPKVVGDKEVIKHELKVTQKGGREVTMGGGANDSKGSEILLNRQNPVSENSSKIRNPFTFGAKSSDKVSKDSGFEKIKAYAEDLREESVFGRVEYSRKLE